MLCFLPLPVRPHRYGYDNVRPSLLAHAGQLQKTLARPEIGILVSLGLRWEGSVGRPEIDQRLHGLKLSRLQHVQGSSRQHKVREATVELLLKVEVVKGLGKVSPVQMGVDAEHLSEDHLANVDKLVREARSLADPFGLTGVGQLGERCGGDGGIV